MSAWNSPTMTSNTAPAPYVVSASLEYGATYAAWKAMDGNTSTFWDHATGPTASGAAWWKIDVGLAFQVCVTYLSILNYANYGFHNFKLQGSNNNIDWIDIQTLHQDNNNSLNEFIITNTVYFRYHQLYCIDSYNANDLATYSINMSGDIIEAPAAIDNRLVTRKRERLMLKGVSLGPQILTDNKSSSLISLRNRFRVLGVSLEPTTRTIMVDGAFWMDAVKTVGSGRDFSTFKDAVADANAKGENCLYLIYDSHTCTGSFTCNNDCAIRGMGALYSDVVVSITTDFTCAKKCWTENIIISTGAIWTCAIYFNSTTGTFKANKCHLSATNSGYSFSGGATATSPTCVLKNTLLSRGYAHILYQDLSKVSLIKVSHGNSWNTYLCSNSLPGDADKASDGTVDYGPMYGNLELITGV
jgi:hypothetical protein